MHSPHSSAELGSSEAKERTDNVRRETAREKGAVCNEVEKVLMFLASRGKGNKLHRRIQKGGGGVMGHVSPDLCQLFFFSRPSELRKARPSRVLKANELRSCSSIPGYPLLEALHDCKATQSPSVISRHVDHQFLSSSLCQKVKVLRVIDQTRPIASRYHKTETSATGWYNDYGRSTAHQKKKTPEVQKSKSILHLVKEEPSEVVEVGKEVVECLKVLYHA